MEVEVASQAEFGDAAPHDVVEWCRSAQSRRAWPGTGEVLEAEGHIFFGVSLRAPGAPDAELRVEERLGPVEGDGPDWKFTSKQRWLWPTGETASGWAEYRLSDAGRRTSLQVRTRYLIPGHGVERAINRVRFTRAVEHAVERYVSGLVLMYGQSPRNSEVSTDNSDDRGH